MCTYGVRSRTGGDSDVWVPSGSRRTVGRADFETVVAGLGVLERTGLTQMLTGFALIRRHEVIDEKRAGVVARNVRWLSIFMSYHAIARRPSTLEPASKLSMQLRTTTARCTEIAVSEVEQGRLSGHSKTGQRWSPQNRPTGRRQDSISFNPVARERATIFLTSTRRP